MGNLVQSETKSFKGPFILDNSALESLHTILEQVVSKLDEGLIAAIEEKAESIVELQLESGKPVFSMNKARQVVRERALFKKKETTVELVSSDDTRLKDTSILNILKDPKAGLLNPTELNIRFQRGPCDFRMDVVSGGEHGGIDVEVWCGSDSIGADIWHLIKGWFDGFSPNFLLGLFAKVVPLVWVALGMTFFFMLISDFTGGGDSRESQYQQILKDHAKVLLADGIDSSEVEDALTTLLEMQSKIIPDTFVAQAESPAPGLQKNTILVGISLFLSISTPRTVIGLGKKRRLAILYKYWIAAIIAWLPTSILLPWLVERLF